MITANIVGVGDVVRRLERIPWNIAAKLETAVNAQAAELLRLVKEKVSGDVLRNRTGTLRRKLNMEMEASATRIVGKVGIKLSYAAAHEFGSKASGTTTVREHLRRLKIVRAMKRGRLVVKSYDGVATVHAHRRNWRTNLPERSYLRTALAERKQAIQDAIRGAIEGGIAQ
jgi:phage gpG-like protein